MIESYHRVGSSYIALNAQFEVVGIIKMFEDDYKSKYKKRIRTKPREPTKGVD